MDGLTIAFGIELTAIGIGLITAYTKLIRTIENHSVRLKYIEDRLDRIEKKIDKINGRQ